MSVPKSPKPKRPWPDNQESLSWLLALTPEELQAVASLRKVHYEFLRDFLDRERCRRQVSYEAFHKLFRNFGK